MEEVAPLAAELVIGRSEEAEERREKWEEGGMDGKEIRGLKQEGEEGKIKKGSRKELRKGGE